MSSTTSSMHCSDEEETNDCTAPTSRMDVDTSSVDHESDSNVIFRRRVGTDAEKAKNEICDSQSNLSETKSPQTPKVVLTKPKSSNQLVQVKPIGLRPTNASSSSGSGLVSSKLGIDKIAENLKLNLQQKEQQAKLKEKAAAAAIVKTTPHVTLQVHDQGQLPIVKSVQPKRYDIKEQDEIERRETDEELTDLSWLTTFNVAVSVGLPANYPLSLSPPITPPESAMRHMQTTIKSTSIYTGDEADGASSKFISAILKKFEPSIMSPSEVGQIHYDAAQDDSKNSLHRPPYSFSCLTFLAIESSPRKRLSVKEIYTWITQHFPYYSSVPSGSWKNSIRHNLSYNNCFAKVDKNLLAMRDFSGKGSLWCVNPQYRSLLIDSWLKLPADQQNKLSSIPFLQDVNETPKTCIDKLVTNNQADSNTVASKSSVEMNTRVDNVAQRKSMYKRSKSAAYQPTVQLKNSYATPTKTIINPQLANRFGAATLNPKLTSIAVPWSNKVDKTSPSASKKSATMLSKILSKSMASLKTSKDDADTTSEMDAVNALLSMKSNTSRSFSSTRAEPSTAQPTTTKTTTTMLNPLLFKNLPHLQPPKPLVQSPNTATTSKAINKNVSRRKQILKPPTKKLESKKLIDEQDEVDGNGDKEFDENDEFNMIMSDEDDPYAAYSSNIASSSNNNNNNNNNIDSEDETEEGEITNANSMYMHEPCTSKQAENHSHKAKSKVDNSSKKSASNSKKPKNRLLVKFPSYNAKRNRDENATTSGNDYENDVSVNNNNARSAPAANEPSVVEMANASIINALLELSRAAKLIEEQKKKTFEACQPKSKRFRK